MRIALLAESDLPQRILESLAPTLEQDLAERLDDGREWTVEVGRETIPLDDDGRVPLDAYAEDLRRRWEADLVVYLTDLPRLLDGQPLVADLSSRRGAALISVPAHGLALRRRAHDILLRTVTALAEGDDAAFDLSSTRRHVLRPPSRASETDSGDRVFELTGVRAYTRLLLGMVRANRPWRLAPALSSATAAATATGAFGIFYSSVWSMADASSPQRLTLVSLLAITVMSAWLIGYNGLWERGSSRREATLYNASMLATVAAAVTIMYTLLFTVFLVAAVVVIDPDFMSRQLGKPAGAGNYVVLAWLTASLGMVAGALGSTWDGDQEVREAIFGRRGYQRRTQTSGWEVSDAQSDS